MMQETGDPKQEQMPGRGAIKHFTDLQVYQCSYSLAMDVFMMARSFPREELYSLTAQLNRAARSIPANIAEGWARRKHENVFKKHLLDAIGSVDEMKTWIEFAKDCRYITPAQYAKLMQGYKQTGARLYKLHQNWQTT